MDNKGDKSSYNFLTKTS